MNSPFNNIFNSAKLATKRFKICNKIQYNIAKYHMSLSRNSNIEEYILTQLGKRTQLENQINVNKVYTNTDILI